MGHRALFVALIGAGGCGSESSLSAMAEDPLLGAEGAAADSGLPDDDGHPPRHRRHDDTGDDGMDDGCDDTGRR